MIHHGLNVDCSNEYFSWHLLSTHMLFQRVTYFLNSICSCKSWVSITFGLDNQSEAIINTFKTLSLLSWIILYPLYTLHAAATHWRTSIFQRAHLTLHQCDEADVGVPSPTRTPGVTSYGSASRTGGRSPCRSSPDGSSFTEHSTPTQRTTHTQAYSRDMSGMNTSNSTSTLWLYCTDLDVNHFSYWTNHSN